MFDRVRAICRALVWLAAMTCVVSVSACGDPCKELSEQICDCERTERDRQFCRQRVARDADAANLTDEQQNECEHLKKSCTCDALEVGDIDKCGLSTQPPPE